MSEKSDHERVEPLALSPRATAIALDCSIDRVYRLIKARELIAYKDGSHTKITMASIKARQARLLAAPFQPTSIAANRRHSADHGNTPDAA